MQVPLIETLLTGALPNGTSILVEYDPASQWYNASLTVAADWLNAGGNVSYHAAAQPLDNARAQLKRLGLDAEGLESGGRLELWDWYTCSLGRKSTERLAMDSLKMSDMSIWWSKHRLSGQPTPRTLRIVDNLSCLARFNDEKTWVEFVVSRVVPSARVLESSRIVGVVRGIHDDWVYKTLEAAHDGIIDIKLEEAGDEPRELIRVRSMRTVGFDRKWRRLRIGENFQITLNDQSASVVK